MKIDAKSMILVALFSALTAVGAVIRIPIPFSPIPITLQVLFVLLSGALLGANLGALSQLIYIFLGCLGLPVFAGGSGMGVLVGPTGGYIFGFILAAYVVGKLVENKNNLSYFRIFLTLMVGVLIIYLVGAFQLMLVAKLDFTRAILGGVIPFIGPDIVKAFLATFLTKKVKPIVG
ncbi:biotin transporter BioY [Candidatus Oleimmundimicrobium sp.]|uniref:biotin transporter BioY n=1 Tax=Candidatus Oleimmundimicrobium sp. TaxID=3060597 RepID=UPI00272042CE|nr:biotin transporter BioY [Candidatus Oleimmundimicrobium sp.]MDO8885655.1 biotin transporter BioY [Candidatus Oleimmundimicrobium sp.]